MSFKLFTPSSPPSCWLAAGTSNICVRVCLKFCKRRAPLFYFLHFKRNIYCCYHTKLKVIFDHIHRVACEKSSMYIFNILPVLYPGWKGWVKLCSSLSKTSLVVPTRTSKFSSIVALIYPLKSSSVLFQSSGFSSFSSSAQVFKEKTRCLNIHFCSEKPINVVILPSISN